MALPWSSSLDVSYVGNHGYNRLGAFQGGQRAVNLNAVDFGAAYLPQNQDPTLGARRGARAPARYTTNLLRPYRGLSNITQQTTTFHDTYHSIQTSFNRRFRNGLAFGANYTLEPVADGQHRPAAAAAARRRRHDLVRADQAAVRETLNKQLEPAAAHPQGQCGVGPARTCRSAVRRSVVGLIVNDWQLSGVLTAGSRAGPTRGSQQPPNGHTTSPTPTRTTAANVNLTGSPDYAAKIVYVGDPGIGLLDNQYAQFNTAAVTGPTYGSVGLESGRNILVGCPDQTVDLALARNIRVGGGRQLQFRLDVFNAFNTVINNDRNTNVPTAARRTRRSSTRSTWRTARSIRRGCTPRNAGFGAATGAQPMRNMQLSIRFQF